MRLLALFAILVSSFLAAAAQTPQATPPPQPPPQPTPNSTPLNQPVRATPLADMTRMQSFPLNPVSESNQLAAKVDHLQRVVAPLYRKPTGKELLAVAPSGELLTKYAAFLRQENTGIFKLVPDNGCATNMRVVDAREECLKYSLPGAGNSYSFRTENYRIRHLADVTLDGGKLKVTGLFMHGMISNLGDIAIEEVRATSPGMKFITDFKPSTSADDVRHIDESFAKGIEVRNFRYSKAVQVEENTTYAYRGVAYRGKIVRSADGVAYNELEYDKREDVTVVFRVVGRDRDGSITIIWKKLVEIDSPKIKLPDTKDDDNDAGEGN